MNTKNTNNVKVCERLQLQRTSTQRNYRVHVAFIFVINPVFCLWGCVYVCVEGVPVCSLSPKRNFSNIDH